MQMTQTAQADALLEEADVLIHVNGENAFLTEDELKLRLKRKGFTFNGQLQKDLKVSAVEDYIRKMTEVKEVKVFTKIGSSWKIEVVVRKPIARIYNRYDETFYLDEDGFVMNSSALHTARVVVVTGYIKDRISSVSVPEIIHLKKNGDFVLIPLVGGQKIVFGTAKTDKEVSDKFKKLKVFYEEGIPYEGWDKYEEISLKYDNQIVCKTVEGYIEEEKTR
jgi:cell division protein FtsQ